MDNKNLFVYGITLSDGSNFTALSTYGTIDDLLKAIEKSDWISFKTCSEWDIYNEKYKMETVAVRNKDIISINY